MKNPLCIDSPAGMVHTYLMTDVVNYVNSALQVAVGRVNWAVGEYSNGGECTLSLGSVATTIRLGFGGNAAA